MRSHCLTRVSIDTVIADAVYVLSSRRLYNLPRSRVAEPLTALVRLPGFRVDHRAAVLRALELYGSTNIDFGDGLIVGSTEHAGSEIDYSFDTRSDPQCHPPLARGSSHRRGARHPHRFSARIACCTARRQQTGSCTPYLWCYNSPIQDSHVPPFAFASLSRHAMRSSPYPRRLTRPHDLRWP